MDAERWALARRIFEDAVELDSDERPAFVANACRDDAALRAEVESLLDSDETAATSHWIDEGAVPAADGPAAPSVSQVGTYRIVRLLGSGGMGSVFEAEQARPHRRVALKLMALGLRSDAARRRFLDESETLARLQHPSIAQVYEAGEHPDPLGGEPLPFFAMELVKDGRDVLRWVEEERPPVRRIVELLAGICDAVHHGHLHGVIHRDLKPANLLVDSAGRPRVIDFGIARCIDDDGEAPPLRTAAGQVVGTLPYMSPEQVGGRDVDARSDVYSLGVVAYRLLGGRLPIAVDDDVATAARAIAESEPKPLGRIDPRLRGDLEVVVGRALEKEPQRRYQSASELGADLRRVLDLQPISARPPSTLYQLGKLARRHKVAVAAGGVALAALLVTVVVVLVQNVRVRRERTRTERIGTFLASVLSTADAFESRGPDHPVRAALDDAAARIEAELGEDPLLEAPIRHVVGRTYLSLGLIDEAAPHVERAYELRREMLGEDDPATLDSLGVLAMLRREQGRTDEALALAQAAVDGSLRNGTDDPLARASALHNLAVTSKDAGDLETAERLYAEVIELRTSLLGPEDPRTLVTRHNLGALQLDTGRLDEAERTLTDVLDARTRTLGPEHPDTAITLDVLGRVHRSQHDLERAIDEHRRAHAILARRLGPEHSDTLAAAQHLAWALLENGEAVEAREIAVPAAETTARVLGPSHARSLHVARIAAAAEMASGDAEAAERRFRSVVDRSRDAFGDGDRRTRSAIADLAYLLRQLGRPEDAFALLRPALERGVPVDPALFSGLLAGGFCLADLGRTDEAERALLRALDVGRELSGEGGPDELTVARALAGFYDAVGNPDERDRWARHAQAIAGGR